MSHTETQNMLMNLAGHLSSLPTFFYVVSGVIGAVLILVGLVRISSLGRQRMSMQKGELAGPITMIFTGILFVSLWSFINLMVVSIFGDSWGLDAAKSDAGAVLTYADSSVKAGHAYGGYIIFSIVVVILVGMYGIMAGLIMLNRSFGDSKSFWLGAWHLMGGVFCVNIVQVLHMTGASIGGQVQEFIQGFLN